VNDLFSPLKVAAFAGALMVGALVIFTERLELVAVLALPAVLVLLRDYRLGVIATLWAMLLWTSRLPSAVLGFAQFSYVVYASMAVCLASYALSLTLPGRRTPWIGSLGWGPWLLMAALLAAGVRGAMNAELIPAWIDETGDISRPWAYFRMFALPGIFQLLLALMIAAAFSRGQYPSRIFAACGAMMWILDLAILGMVLVSGTPLHDLAQADQREFLNGLGFHANEFGAFLAISYALMLGLWPTARSPRAKLVLGSTIVLTLAALSVTFSRGGYLACAAVTGLFFIRGTAKQKMAFLLGLACLWIILPTAVLDRIQYGADGGDLNSLSAGRIEWIWLPLLNDVSNHLLLGQGLNSVMWTDAQRMQLMAPVFMAHSGYLDLLLDFGIVGAIPVAAAYAYLWRGLLQMHREDPDIRLRNLFYGGHLAMVAFALVNITSDKVTPTATTLFLWIAGGIMMARRYWLRASLRKIAFEREAARMRHEASCPARPAIAAAQVSKRGFG